MSDKLVAPKDAKKGRASAKVIVLMALLVAATVGLFIFVPSHSPKETPPTGAIAAMQALAPAPANSCSANVVMADRIQADWPTLTIPANGDSEHIKVCGGLRPRFTNDGYEIHVVYRDAPECIMGDSRPRCPDGQVIEEYLHDTTGKERKEVYAFEKISQ